MVKYAYQLLLDFIKERPYHLAVDAVYYASVPLNEVLLPYLYGKTVTALQKGGNFGRYLWIVVGVLLLAQVVDLAHSAYMARVEPQLTAFARERLLADFVDSVAVDYKDRNIGDVFTGLSNVPSTLASFYGRLKDSVIPHLVAFVIQNVYFFAKDRVMGAVLALVFAVIFTLMLTSPFACSGPSGDKKRAASALYAHVEDVLNNLVAVFTSDTLPAEQRQFARLNEAHMSATTRTTLCALNFKLVSLPIFVAFLVVFVVRSTRKKIDSGTFVALFSMILSSATTLNWFVDVIRGIVSDTSVLSNVVRFSEGTAQRKPPACAGVVGEGIAGPEAGGAAGPEAVPALEARGLVLRGGQRGLLLDGVSLRVVPGERVGIVGDVGSGKTTLMKVLTYLVQPDEGCVLVAGQPIARGSAFAYVPQAPLLLNRSLYDNLVYGTGASKGEVNALLAKYPDIATQLNDFPLSSAVGKHGANLSGGQRQLVYCLRTVLARPDVMLLDEPSSAMSGECTSLLMRVLSAEAKTVVLITHDPQLEQLCTRSVRMSRGKLTDEPPKAKN